MSFFLSFKFALILSSGLVLLSILGANLSEGTAEKKPILNTSDLNVEEIVDGLKHPTSMAFLGPDDILVLEKNSGNVKRVVDGKLLDKPLLHVKVADDNHRGMLGIDITRKENENVYKGDLRNASGASNSKNISTYVFLFYTASSGYNRIDDCPEINFCIEENEPLGNRLYKYELSEGDKLIKRKLLLDLQATPGSDHIGGVFRIGPDHNIYLVSGDGHGCAADSCKEDKLNSTILNTLSANVLSGLSPSGRGGILRVTQDGNSVGDGILGSQDPLKKYYAYGIRNSFGLDFDPVTGNLWDTENGASFGDEINLVEPGFNSGWLRIQGIWPIHNIDLLVDGLYQYNDLQISKEEYGVSNINKNLVNFQGRGKYSDPEFTWNQTIGVTSLKFLNSNKLGNQYENDMFVGDFNGNIYQFDLNEDRTSLSLKGSLKDKVAESSTREEIKDIIFGEGFYGVTDIEVGPDGYLYVLSFLEGKIFKISPTH